VAKEADEQALAPAGHLAHEPEFNQYPLIQVVAVK